MNPGLRYIVAGVIGGLAAACTLQVPARRPEAADTVESEGGPQPREADPDSAATTAGDDGSSVGAGHCPGLCPSGFVCLEGKDSAGAICLPGATYQCTPCVVDANCLGGACGKVGGEGPYCLIPCAVGAAGATNCPTGSACQATEKGSLCVPATGSCTCTAATQQASQPCTAPNGCVGTRVCGPAGWGACAAAPASAEVCDGVDNDCNGKTDDLPAAQLAFDKDHCGSCSKSCPKEEDCVSGTCMAEAAQNWTTLGGDNRHTGAKLGQPAKLPLSPDWTVQMDVALHSVATDETLVYVSRASTWQKQVLRAYDLSNGKLAWEHDFGSVFSVGQPSAVAGKVYVGVNNGSKTFLWVLDAATGKELQALPMVAQWATYWAPLVVANSVYSNGGNYGGLYGFVPDQDKQLFFTTLEQWDHWSPGQFQGLIYTFVAGNLRAHDPQTGTAVWSKKVDWTVYGYAMKSAPVFDASQGYVVAPPTLHAFEPKSGEILWSKNSLYDGFPAVADSQVFALHAGQLHVLAAQDGSLIWNFVGNSDVENQPLVTSDHVFLASSSHVTVVNRKTHEVDATLDTGGWLALAPGRLLVAGAKGNLSAWKFAK